MFHKNEMGQNPEPFTAKTHQNPTLVWLGRRFYFRKRRSGNSDHIARYREKRFLYSFLRLFKILPKILWSWFSMIFWYFLPIFFRSVTVYIRYMIHISCGLLHGIQFWGTVDAITEALKKAGQAREKLGLKQQRCSKHGLNLTLFHQPKQSFF